MKRCRNIFEVFCLVVFIGSLWALPLTVPDAGASHVIRGDFRVTATFGDVGIGPPAFTNAEACDHDFESARGTIKIKEKHGKTKLTIKIKGAVPDEFYTVWLRLNGTSPLTGLPATPLVATSDLDDLAAITPPNPGSIDQPNSFFTNHRGKGKLKYELDFLLSDGVYPFEDGDVPTATVPFTVALASHCVDHTGHGLVPGPHENTFQWP